MYRWGVVIAMVLAAVRELVADGPQRRLGMDDLFEESEQTVTSDTAEKYRVIFANRLEQARELVNGEDDSPSLGQALAAGLGESDLGLASFKQYASAIRWCLEDGGNDQALRSFDFELDGVERPDPRKRHVLKFVPPDVGSAVIETAHRSKRKFSRHLAVLLCCTLATGLRPKEWSDTSILLPTGEPFRLRVVNGKYVPPGTVNSRSTMPTARRGNGPYRELVFDAEEDEAEVLLADIRELLEYEEEQPWKRCQKGLRRELDHCLLELVENGIIQRLFLKLTIYSFRHQAAADAKANLGTVTGGAAALLGHASARTAVDSYGRRQLGRSGVMMRPSAASVEAVDNLNVPTPPERPGNALRGPERAPEGVNGPKAR